MNGKKFLILFVCPIAVLSIVLACMFTICQKQPPEVETEKVEIQVQQQMPKPAAVSTPEIKKINLYAESLYDMPLYSIAQVNELTPQIQKTINTVLEQAQGFYFLKLNKHDNSVEIILQNPVEEKQVYPRHQLQIAHINSLGNVKYKDTGYTGIDGEINADFEENNKDVWIYDEKSEVQRPIEHISYDESGNIEFSEKWNYSDSDEIKYEQRDAHKKLISVIKELPNGEKYRKEHIFYDKNGHIIGSMTINYEGANICDFNYYSSKDNEGVTIINEYNDGVKTKENIYNKDYELVNTVTAEYKDGIRTKITVLDLEGKEVETLSN